MPLAAWLALHAGISALATWLALAYARRRNLIDHPGERRSHAVATPRGGGIGIAIALLAGCALLLATGRGPTMAMASFATGLVLVAGIGWIDDHRPLSPWLRLAVQCLAGALLAWGMHGVEGRWGWALLTLGLVPVLVNVWNFMDGIDGLAASQAMLAAVACAWLAPGIAPLALALAVACAAFLPFNFPHARIFLGDAGSGTLGYALAALVAGAAPELGVPMAALLLLPLSAFLVDASLTLVSRVAAGERWWQPHVSHVYQRWVRTGRSHAFVTSVYVAFTLAAIVSGALLHNAGPWPATVGVMLWLACAVPVWAGLRRRMVPGKVGQEDA